MKTPAEIAESEANRLSEYEALRATGLGDHEARETVWGHE